MSYYLFRRRSQDPRITYVPELQQYAVAYTAYSKGGPGVSLALTKDFRTFERYGFLMSPDDKDAALLPHRIRDLQMLSLVLPQLQSRRTRDE